MSTTARLAAPIFDLSTEAFIMKSRVSEDGAGLATRFLSEMSFLMGLPDASPSALAGPHPFFGPGGLMCRLQLQCTVDGIEVQPQVLLPLQGEALWQEEIGQVLLMQAAILSETGWHLSVSCEGLLQLSMLSWINEPGEAVRALDVGNTVAAQTLKLLTVLDEEDPVCVSVEDFVAATGCALQ